MEKYVENMTRRMPIEKISIVLKLLLIIILAFGKISVNTYAKTINETLKKYPNDILDTNKIKDIDYLKKTFFSIDPWTDILPSDIDVTNYLNDDLTISVDGNKPKVLIIHSHASELYVDSQCIDDGVIAVGSKLSEALNKQYSIPNIHDITAYDIVNGEFHHDGAYTRVRDSVVQTLNENPSIEIIIDLQRDGVPQDIKYVTKVNSKPTAQINFVNGLSRIYENGVLQPTEEYPNSFVLKNLSFSFNMQLAANTFFPNFARKIYIAPYNYSLNLLPKSLLIYVGAQTNTKQEAENAAPLIAEILAYNVMN
jgi:stage II sporulation protein P